MTTNSVDKVLHTAAPRAHEFGSRNGIRLQNPKALEKWLHILAIVLAGLWTLLMWGAYGLLSLSDEAVHASTSFFGVDAQMLQKLTSAVGGAQQWGEALVLIVWMLGVILLMLAGWMGRRLIRAFKKPSEETVHAI